MPSAFRKLPFARCSETIRRSSSALRPSRPPGGTNEDSSRAPLAEFDIFNPSFRSEEWEGEGFDRL